MNHLRNSLSKVLNNEGNDFDKNGWFGQKCLKSQKRKKKKKRVSDLGVQGNSPKNVNMAILPPSPSPTFRVAVKPGGRVVAGVRPQGGWVCRFEIYTTPLFWRNFLKASWAVDIERRRAEAALQKDTRS